MGGGDTGGISKKKSQPRELDRTSRAREYGGGKLDTFSGSSKSNYISNSNLDPNFPKLSNSLYPSAPVCGGKTLLGAKFYVTQLLLFFQAIYMQLTMYLSSIIQEPVFGISNPNQFTPSRRNKVRI